MFREVQCPLCPPSPNANTLHNLEYNGKARKLILIHSKELFQISPVMYAPVCVCVCACSMQFYHVQLHVTSTTTKVENCTITTSSSYLIVPLYSLTHFLPPMPYPYHYFVLHLYNCVIPRMLYTWNHTVGCNLLILAFFFSQQNSLGGSFKLLHVSTVHFFLLLESIPQYGCAKM